MLLRAPTRAPLRLASPALRSAERAGSSSALRIKRRGLATEAKPSMELQVTDPLELYRGMAALGKIRSDPEQIRAMLQIRKCHAELLDYNPPIRLLTLLESLRSPTDPLAGLPVPEWPFKRSSLSSIGMELTPEEIAEREEILAMTDKAKTKALVQVLKSENELEGLMTPKGFLLTGPPGTGKSLLMDIFFQSLPIPHKVRYHYHHFLLSIYGKVHEALEAQRFANEAEELAMNASGEYPWSRREEMKALAITKGWRAVFNSGKGTEDAALNTKEFVLASIARDLIKTHGFVLAFDEVQLVDVAGAGMINRLLSWYWRLGGVVIATSNRLPQDLYNSGVQRNSVNTFLDALAARCPPVELRSATDYRREQRGLALDNSTDREAGDFGTPEAWKRWGSESKGWFVRGQEKEFKNAVDRIIGDVEGQQAKLKVYGRDLVVPWAYKGVAKFNFATLCEGALGPADYITLGSTYHTIILTDVPVLLLNAKNEARRLITLIDSLYETKSKLLVMAETGIENLFFPDFASASIKPNTPYVPHDIVTSLSPDDVVTSSGASHPFSADRIYEADATMPKREMRPVDPMAEIGDSLTEEAMSEVMQDLESPMRPNISSYEAGSFDYGKTDKAQSVGKRAPVERRAMDPSGEIGDSLTEEAMSEVMQDLESPYRPNVASYEGGADIYNRDEAKQVARPKRRVTTTGARPDPHPSAATPSFKSLAIFTGEEERFAYKRAVSRVFEMDSSEYLRTAEWAPLSPSLRTWEQSVAKSAPISKSSAPSRSTMGAVLPLSDTKLSGVLDPKDIRLRYPEGLPAGPKTVDVRAPKVPQEKNFVDIRPAGLVAPKIKEEHAWGVRDDYGPKAGEWGKGAKAFEKKE